MAQPLGNVKKPVASFERSHNCARSAVSEALDQLDAEATTMGTTAGGRPVGRYKALAPMIGMESLQAPVEALRQARLASENQQETVREHATDAMGLLRGLPDNRASATATALAEHAARTARCGREWS